MNNKAIINKRVYDAISLDEYNRAQNVYEPKTTAIIDNTTNLLYPVQSDYGRGPGFYVIAGNPINEFIEPDESDKEMYSANSKNMIDFNHIEDMHDYIDKQNAFNNLERTILTNADNIFIPTIGPNDDPVMKGLKEAVISKNIDIDKYESRFGKNFSNDKRLFKGDKITLNKLADMMGNLDIKGKIIIEDANPDVPNPIGRQIVIDLNNKSESNSEE